MTPIVYYPRTPEQRIADRVRAFRRSRGLKIRAAADRIGVAEGTWQAWEVGNSFGYLRRLPCIAEALGVEESDLLGGESERDQHLIEALSERVDALAAEVSELRALMNLQVA